MLERRSWSVVIVARDRKLVATSKLRKSCHHCSSRDDRLGVAQSSSAVLDNSSESNINLRLQRRMRKSGKRRTADINNITKVETTHHDKQLVIPIRRIGSRLIIPTNRTFTLTRRAEKTKLLAKINMLLLLAVCCCLNASHFLIEAQAQNQEDVDILRHSTSPISDQLQHQHQPNLDPTNQLEYEPTRIPAIATSASNINSNSYSNNKLASQSANDRQESDVFDKRIGINNNYQALDQGEQSVMSNNRLFPTILQSYRQDQVIESPTTRAHSNMDPMTITPIDPDHQKPFRRINELEGFLDEMNHNELRDVAAGRPIDNELFKPKAMQVVEHQQPANIAGDHHKPVKQLEPSNNLETAQSTERSSASYLDCALILQRTYVKSSVEDPKHHPLMGLPFGRTEQACIGYKHINKAIEQAKHKLKFRDQQQMAALSGIGRMAKKKRQSDSDPRADPLHTSLEPPSDLVAALGEINMATTQILADQFDLSNDELLNGLPLIDMSKTNFWPICPLLVRQDLKCELSRFRTMTGHCNNLKHPTWGAAMTPFARYLPPIHPDGIWTPRKSIVSELTFHLDRDDSGMSQIPPPRQPHVGHPSMHHASFVSHLDQSRIANTIGDSSNDSMGAAASVQHQAAFVESQRHQLAASSSKLIAAASTSGENLIDSHYQRLQSEGRIFDAASGPGPLINHQHQHDHLNRHFVEPRMGLEQQSQGRGPKGAPAELPPVRLISTVVHHDVDVPNHDFSILFMSWGQLLDHDMTRAAQPPSTIKCCQSAPSDAPGPNGLAPSGSSANNNKHKLCLPIKIPADDPFYAKFNVNCLEFRRSLAGLRPNCVLGPRVHQNAITSPIDANFVYGSSEAESSALRLFQGGRLRDRDWFKHQNLKPLLPAQEEEPDQDCLGRPKDLFCFLAGDVRANEQIHLTVLHTLYMREHNRIADKLGDLNPHWNDERIYQETRHIVAAGVQQVMVSEYIPLLIGKKMASLYNLTGHSQPSISINHELHHHEPGSTAYWHGYDPSVTTSVSNSFAAAAFRQGHTFIQSTVERFNKFHEFIGSEKLRHLFKQPFLLYQPGALDELTSGLINQPAQSYDPFISAEIAGHLFQPPERQFGHDLASINLQRGREQGLPGYNLWREWCGLPRAESFDQLAPYLTNHTAFLYSRLYKHVDDIDLWSGGISERKLPGAAIGPTFACIIARQFSNTRRGDRFWFENPGFPSSFTPEQLAQLRKVSLAKILCANSDDLPTIQRWALRMPHPVLNPRLDCSQIPEIDLRFWQEE